MVQVPKFLHESGSQTTVVSMVFCMSSSNKNIVYEKENKMAINDIGNLRTSGISKKRQHLEPAVRRYSWQSVFLKISQHSQENTCVGKHLKACSFIKKSLQVSNTGFSCVHCKMFKSRFFVEHSCGRF